MMVCALSSMDPERTKYLEILEMVSDWDRMAKLEVYIRDLGKVEEKHFGQKENC